MTAASSSSLLNALDIINALVQYSKKCNAWDSHAEIGARILQRDLNLRVLCTPQLAAIYKHITDEHHEDLEEYGRMIAEWFAQLAPPPQPVHIQYKLQQLQPPDEKNDSC